MMGNVCWTQFGVGLLDFHLVLDHAALYFHLALDCHLVLDLLDFHLHRTSHWTCHLVLDHVCCHW